MSIWADYLKERTGAQVLETQWGFLVFHFEEPKICFIDDIYVLPHLRQKGLGRSLADRLKTLARERECNTLAAQVIPIAQGSTEALKAILAYGFRLVSAENGRIILRMDLGGS